MSFGFSIGDFITIAQLASKVVTATRKACGAHDDLTREVTSLHIVLRQLQREVAKPNSILKSDYAEQRAELATLIQHCRKVLKVLDDILQKYNGLSSKKGRFARFWKQVQFGNREMQDLSKTRLELSTHTNVITMFLNLSTVGSLGKVEEHMISHGEELKAVRRSVNWVTASMQASAAGGRDGSILTSYTNDDKTFWKEFRRELIKDGCTSRVLKKHRNVIQDYVKELGDCGALDDVTLDDTDSTIEDESNTSSAGPNARDEPLPVLEVFAGVLFDQSASHAGALSPSTAPTVDFEAENVGKQSHMGKDSVAEDENDLSDSDSDGSGSLSDEEDAHKEHLSHSEVAENVQPTASIQPTTNTNINYDADATKEPDLCTSEGPGSDFAKSSQSQSDIDEDATPSRARQEHVFHDKELSENFATTHTTATAGPALKPPGATFSVFRRQQETTNPKASIDHACASGNIPMTSICSGNENVTIPIHETDVQTNASENEDEIFPPICIPLIPVFVGASDGSWDRVYRPDSGSATYELDVITSRFEELIPLCLNFVCMESATHQEYEYKKLTEALLNEGLLRLDAIDVDDAAIKAMRRSLVRRVQYIMEQLDAAHCGGEGRRSFRSFLDEAIDGAPEPEAPSRPTISPRREAWKRFTAAYIKSACKNVRSQHGSKSSRRSPVSLPNVPRNIATELDARRHGIQPGYRLDMWDPACKPIVLFDRVMHAEILGKRIYDWTIFFSWRISISRFADAAVDLWYLLIDLGCYVSESRDCIGSVETRDCRETLKDFVESGERLITKLQELLKECEDCFDHDRTVFDAMQEGTKDMSAFIITLFGSREQALSRWMASVRLWLRRFDSNCIDILDHVVSTEEESEFSDDDNLNSRSPPRRRGRGRSSSRPGSREHNVDDIEDWVREHKSKTKYPSTESDDEPAPPPLPRAQTFNVGCTTDRGREARLARSKTKYASTATYRYAAEFDDEPSFSSRFSHSPHRVVPPIQTTYRVGQDSRTHPVQPRSHRSTLYDLNQPSYAHEPPRGTAGRPVLARNTPSGDYHTSRHRSRRSDLYNLNEPL